MKSIKGRAKLLICTTIVLFIVLAIIPEDADGITNAAINPNNGDIAFSYYDSSSKVRATKVDVYNKHGELLFSKVTSNDGGSYASLKFIDNKLYVSSGRKQLKYCFDMDGSDLDYTSYSFEERETFDDWKWGLRKRTFQYEDYLYVYKPPVIFRDKALLTVTNGDGEVAVIYKDP